MAKKSEYQLAAQMYSLRDYCGTPQKLASTLKKVRKIGYRNVQVSGPMGSQDPLAVKKMCDDNGLSIIGHHTSLAELRSSIVNLIDTLHVYDCHYTAVAYLADDERKNLGDYKKRAKEMTKFGKVLAAEGITLQYHNHAFEFEKFGGKKKGTGPCTGLEILYKESDPKYLQAEIDTCWVARGGADVVAWIQSMKGRMDQIHFKDTTILDNQPIFAEIGEGNINWPEVLKACKAIKVKDYIVEQDNCPITKNPFTSLEISYKNLRKMGLK